MSTCAFFQRVMGSEGRCRRQQASYVWQSLLGGGDELHIQTAGAMMEATSPVKTGYSIGAHDVGFVGWRGRRSIVWLQ